jgi:hypothetical protein
MDLKENEQFLFTLIARNHEDQRALGVETNI